MDCSEVAAGTMNDFGRSGTPPPGQPPGCAHTKLDALQAENSQNKHTFVHNRHNLDTCVRTKLGEKTQSEGKVNIKVLHAN